jgi:hypothetical protein
LHFPMRLRIYTRARVLPTAWIVERGCLARGELVPQDPNDEHRVNERLVANDGD